MTTYKYKDINTSVDKDKTTIEDNGSIFYTEDKGTTALRLFINWRGQPFNLDNTTMKPVLDLFHSDGSIWRNEPLEVINAESGLVQYKLPNNIIAHAGNVRAKFFLKNTDESVHIANFDFIIKDSGIEGSVAKEISVNIVDDAVRRIVKENAIEILGDGFEGRLNTDVINHLDSNPDMFKGDKGDKGDIGARGPQGPQGVKGDTGATGQNGQDGAQGMQGPRGYQGVQGSKGNKGEIGPKGDIGPKGEDGKNSTQINYRDIKIHADIPAVFEGYNNLLQETGATHYYPQGLAKDDEYWYVLFSHDSSIQGGKRIVVVYDEYFIQKSIIDISNVASESIYVTNENNEKMLYAISDNENIAKYNISDINNGVSYITPTTESLYKVDPLYNFAKTNNGWVVEKNNESKGYYKQRDTFFHYNNDFSEIINTYYVAPSVGNFWSSRLSNYSLKRQGITFLNNTMYQVVGGNYVIGEKVGQYNLQGVLEIGPNGKIINDYTYNPMQLSDYLNETGKEVNRIEHEGAFTHEGKLYSLIIYNTTISRENSNKNGILIVEYGSKTPDKTMEGSSILITTPSADYDPYKKIVNRKITNDYTGQPIDTLNDLLFYMIDTFQSKVVFYSSHVDIKDSDNVDIENGLRYEVENLDNKIFFITVSDDYKDVIFKLKVNRSTETVQKINRNENYTTRDIDLSTINYNFEGYVYNSSNGPSGVSKEGHIKVMTNGTKSVMVYNPFNSYETYKNIFYSGAWQGWKKITTVT